MGVGKQLHARMRAHARACARNRVHRGHASKIGRPPWDIPRRRTAGNPPTASPPRLVRDPPVRLPHDEGFSGGSGRLTKFSPVNTGEIFCRSSLIMSCNCLGGCHYIFFLQLLG
jgi:hypothetical protein